MFGFQRNTHDRVTKQPRKDITKEMNDFWQKDGGSVGHYLDSENSLPFDYIVSEINRDDFNNPDGMSEQEVALCLIGLLEHGMATVELIPQGQVLLPKGQVKYV